MIGKEILNYVILSLIGKGGMGSVYLAQNKYINQQKVAIKVINSNMINDFTRQTFAQEADKLARLNHPNIVHFINYHIDDEGNIYLIMEYADGYSLEDSIKNVTGLIVEEKICPIFEPILDAFEYAHKNKIVHKDIKPSNIILTKDGTPKILDFGISSLLDDSGKDGGNGMIMGTPSYMSPEQVQGQPLDQRSDIYALGVLLHQMLTGNPPYDTTTLTEHEIHKHIVNDSLPRMKTYYKYVSEKVQKVVDKATCKNPQDRYQNCQDFKKALHTAIYPPKIPVWTKVTAGAVAALILAGVIFAWDYNRVKVSFYKDYVEQWGIPQGIGKISSADSKHTHRMYRFESRHYRLQRLSHVNSLGNLTSDGESERNDRPMDAEFFYANGSKLSRVKVKDANGRVLYVKSYNENLNTVVFQYADEHGTEKRLGNETIGYVHAFDANQSTGKISRYLLDYDDKGYVSRLRYAGFQNVLASDINRIYGKQYVRDSKGRVVEESYLAHDGSPKATKWGMGKKLFEYDENDNWVRTIYQTVDGKPALDAPDGTAICENEYDSYGNQVAQYFKNSAGQLTITQMQDASGVKTEYDEQGFLVKQSYIGTDGSPIFSTKHGYATVVAVPNEYGYNSEIKYYDAASMPCVVQEGYARVSIITDAKGNVLRIAAYGLDGTPVLSSSGYHGYDNEFDELGQLVKCSYFGVDGAPCVDESGAAGYNRTYTERGDILSESYFDVEGRAAKDNNGVAEYVYERDSRGNLARIVFNDEHGKFTTNNEGLAYIEFQYDDNGNETSRKFFNAEGERTRGYVGYAQRTHTYDDNGNELSDVYMDVNGEPMLVNGIAGWYYKVDERGNTVEKKPVDTNGKLAKGHLIERDKFDERDNVIEESYFDADGKPAQNSQKYHKVEYVFNERNQEVEESYYDKNGKYTKYGTNSYAIVRYEYDDRGLCTKVSFFGTDNQPTMHKDGGGSYASHVSKYDDFGRVVRQYYFDTQGKPTSPKVMVPEGAVGYDQWGNLTYLAAMDGSGRLIRNPQSGWSYMTAEYDNRHNVLRRSFFDENEKPMLCRDGYHAEVCTYTPTGKKETESYHDTKGFPMNVNGVHQYLYKYNPDSDLLEEIVLLNTSLKPTNNGAGVHKVVFTYNDDGSYKYRKYYNLAGRLVYQEQYLGEEWVKVNIWQNSVYEFSESLPVDLGDEVGNLEIQWIKVISNSKAEVTFTVPHSKYDMSESMLEDYCEFAEELTTFIKSQLGIPRNVTLKGILKDSRGRELAVYNK